jgi:hypothetical protein
MNDQTPSPTRYWIFAAGGIAAVAGAVAAFLWLNKPVARDHVEAPEPPKPLPSTTLALPQVRFTDVTESAGITFVHTNGSTGKKLLPETLGSGCAFFDYDNDGDQDLLLVNARPWPGDEASGAMPTMAFYQNDGAGRFTDVTESVGLAVSFFGMGAAAADYDNDGFTDVFITGVGGNHLFRNNNGQRFVDVADDAAVAGPKDWPADDDFLAHANPITWSTSAAWLDYDRDGFLDLFVCNYVRWSPKIDTDVGYQLTGIGRAFGPPTNFEGANCLLYHNGGNGSFEDVSADAGIQVFSTTATQVPVGKSLGVIAADLDDDGWTDLVVANDTVQNFFFHNSGDGTFDEKAQEVGIGDSSSGSPTGAMGIDGAAVRGDGMIMVPIGNFSNEMTSLYVRQPGSILTMYDEAPSAGVGAPTRQSLTFGTVFLDFDLDGRLDLMTANGHLEEEINQHQPGQHYEQPPQLFWNAGAEHVPEFVLLTEDEVGPDLLRPMVGRGLAYADIDGDGDLDVLITANGGRPRLLRNEAISEGSTNGPHWLRLVLEGTGASRTPIGVKVEVVAGDGALHQHRELLGGRSYLSQSELVLTFGLGSHTAVDEVRITWPGQEQPQVVTGLEIDRAHHIKQPE